MGGHDGLSRSLRLLALCLALCCLFACAKKAVPPFPPSPAVTMDEEPDFFCAWLRPQNQDMTSWTELAPALRRSMAYLQRKPATAKACSTGGEPVTWGELAETAALLHALLPELDANPALFQETFRWISVPGGIKYSSYYEPRMRASRKPAPGLRPIYALPPEMRAYKARHKGKYHSREKIDGGLVLAGRGLELAWADPVDIYFLQIQGSGRLQFDDGTEAWVNYAGQNGHKYRASGRIMAEKGVRLRRGDIFEQREWFAAHPERMDEIFFENPSYVFFQFGTRGAIGAMGYPIEEWISLATDPGFLPLGSVVAFGVGTPVPGGEVVTMRGIGLAQDKGGAIKGNRIDLYAGGSDRGRYVASFLDAQGPAWLLLRR